MNTDFTPGDFLTDFLLAQIAQQTPERRVLLYRALACETQDDRLRSECRDRANEIDNFLRKERQLLLWFRSSHATQPSEEPKS